MNVFDLAAKLTLDTSEYEKNLDEAEQKTEKKASKSSKIGSLLGKGVKAAGAAIGVAIGAAATGVSVLVKNSVEAYSNYEQLVGGVETLFGAGGKSLEEYAASVGQTTEQAAAAYDTLMQSQQAMLDNAANAYQTVGMSANDYMETAIGFSGALLKSLGGDTVAAAELTHTAISDMADQANKYGKTVEEVSETYTSLARGNFQTLDNLFGGMFAGTKDGLEEMLEYAENYRASLGETVDYSSDSYADIVQAIHDVSEATGVYGTTQEEAAKTIQGSMSMAKAAWQNFVAGLSNSEADLGALISNLVDSATTVLDNLMPVVEQALVSIGAAIEKLAPIIAERLPGIIETVLPSLLLAATSLVEGLVNALPGIIQVLVDVLPDIIVQITTALISNLPAILDAGLQLAMGLIEALLSVLGQLAEVGWQWVQSIAQGIGQKISDVVAKANELWQQAKAALASAVSAMLQTGIDWITNLIQGIGQKIGEVVAKANELWQQARDAIANAVSHFREVGSNLIGGLISGIVAKAQEVVERVRGVVSNAIQAAKNLLGISSPSKVFRQFGQYLDEGLMLGIKDAAQQPVNAIKSVAASLAKAWDAAGFSMDGNLSANWSTGDSMGSYRSYNYDRGSARMGGRGISIVVNAAQGQSEESIAARVERRLAEAMGKREAVWA